jgi:hypothetical protein
VIEICVTQSHFIDSDWLKSVEIIVKHKGVWVLISNNVIAVNSGQFHELSKGLLIYPMVQLSKKGVLKINTNLSGS